MKKGMLLVHVLDQDGIKSHYRIILLDLVDKRRGKDGNDRAKKAKANVLGELSMNCE